MRHLPQHVLLHLGDLRRLSLHVEVEAQLVERLEDLLGGVVAAELQEQSGDTVSLKNSIVLGEKRRRFHIRNGSGILCL